MNTREPFVVPALAGLIPFRLKAVQQTAQPQRCNFLLRFGLVFEEDRRHQNVTLPSGGAEAHRRGGLSAS